ncbi:MAG: ATP:cob(I)alamin adenosyltransferase [Candidatus Hydrogenedentes bacterium]|nr:ATP:cob(I)alamin adenosyltransferase [Candidatus Hydrogenedentota bacterium]
MKSQVTTGQGDTGETLTLAGHRLPKSHVILECTGTVDELRVHTALARLTILEEGGADRERTADFLVWLLHTYFLVGTACSDPARERPEFRTRDLKANDLARLEAEQARLEQETPLPKGFVVGATSRAAAQVDVACTVARRLERTLVRLKEAEPGFESGAILAFVNRLSDYLFVLARYLERGEHLTVDYSRLDEG